MYRIYVDANVLIAAFRGQADIAERALHILDNPNYRIVLSEAVRLEILPKPVYEKRQDEQRYFEQIFSAAECLPWRLEVLNQAYRLACDHGIAAMDAVHLAMAISARVDAFVTGEKPQKPLFRYRAIPIHSLRDPQFSL